MKKQPKSVLFIVFLCVTIITTAILFTGCGFFGDEETNTPNETRNNVEITVSFMVKDKCISTDKFIAYIVSRENGYKNVELAKTSIPDLDMPGYTCDGWYFEEKLISSYTVLNDKILAGDVAFNLYTTVSPISYTIKYENTKGVSLEGLATSFTIEDSISLADISVKHYDFNGWLKNGEKVTEIAKGTIGDVTLSADLTPIEYEIMYVDTKDAINANPPSYNVENEDIVLQPLSKEGFTFEGWYIDGNKVDTIPVANGGDIEILAKWSKAN